MGTRTQRVSTEEYIFQELASAEPGEHTHSASDITSGTLNAQRLPFATEQEAIDGTATNRLMSPQRTADYVNSLDGGDPE